MKLNFGEIIRFGIVGSVATVLHYSIYWVLKFFLEVNIAYTIGYVTSFVCNFFMSSHFTFRSKATMGRGIGFGMAHFINYTLHIVLLNFFLYIGLSKSLAPIPVFMIAIPVNFLLVRFVFKHGEKK